jgi:hypothetical protein
VGQRFGRFSHKLIWSPCSHPFGKNLSANFFCICVCVDYKGSAVFLKRISLQTLNFNILTQSFFKLPNAYVMRRAKTSRNPFQIALHISLKGFKIYSKYRRYGVPDRLNLYPRYLGSMYDNLRKMCM